MELVVGLAQGVQIATRQEVEVVSFTSSFITLHNLIYHRRRGTHYQMLAHYPTIHIHCRGK